VAGVSRPVPPRTAAPRTAVVTMTSAGRLGHVIAQQRMLVRWSPTVARVIVWLDADPVPEETAFEGAVVVRVPPGEQGLRLAEGRNRGAEAARGTGASILVFLDADCVPGPDLVARYETAAGMHDGALLCGPVTYLPEGVGVGDGDGLADVTHPHAARPAPEPGTTVVATDAEYALFWSLSFAVSASTWERLVGFDPTYEGYGGEDTDFAFAARSAGVELVWVGGAHAYHQYHATSSPPWAHLDDILRNGRIFADRWGAWPMEGWLAAFADAGAISWVDGGGADGTDGDAGNACTGGGWVRVGAGGLAASAPPASVSRPRG